MQAIWKFSLQATDAQTISMPKGAQVLTVQSQRGIPALWAIVDPDAEEGDRTFLTYGTGQPITVSPGEYAGTYQLQGGALVFHVFEENS